MDAGIGSEATAHIASGIVDSLRKLIGEYPSRKAGMFDTESSIAEEPVIIED